MILWMFVRSCFLWMPFELFALCSVVFVVFVVLFVAKIFKVIWDALPFV